MNIVHPRDKVRLAPYIASLAAIMAGGLLYDYSDRATHFRTAGSDQANARSPDKPCELRFFQGPSQGFLITPSRASSVQVILEIQGGAVSLSTQSAKEF